VSGAPPVPVQQQLDALARQHPAALAVALGVPRPAPRAGQAELLLQRGDRGELRGAVARVGLAGDVHGGPQHRHRCSFRARKPLICYVGFTT
jgi:hypothetical protein